MEHVVHTVAQLAVVVVEDVKILVTDAVDVKVVQAVEVVVLHVVGIVLQDAKDYVKMDAQVVQVDVVEDVQDALIYALVVVEQAALVAKVAQIVAMVFVRVVQEHVKMDVQQIVLADVN